MESVGFVEMKVWLEESHIVPKFVYRWLRKSSASWYLRFTANPNKRVQDGTKYYLLCSECEDRLEKWETRFSKSVFYPYLQDFWFHGSYGDWLIKFSVSITWRALSYIRETQGIEYFSEDLGAHADSADQTWREFMLGEAPHPGKFEQHLVLLDAIESHTTPGLPATMNRYLCGQLISMQSPAENRPLYTASYRKWHFLASFIWKGQENGKVLSCM